MLPTNEVSKVQFEISPIHGDCDIFLSRTNKFPNSENKEKESESKPGNVEKVEFTIEDGAFSTSYYMAVYGATYASY